MATFDEKAVLAIAHAFGNYRAATTAAAQDSDHDQYVIFAGRALLALQDYMGIEVADPDRVNEAMDFAREQIEA